MDPKVEKRFVKAVLSSGLLQEEDIDRARGLQAHAAKRGLNLPLDRIFLKLNLLSRDQILGLRYSFRRCFTSPIATGSTGSWRHS